MTIMIDEDQDPMVMILRDGETASGSAHSVSGREITFVNATAQPIEIVHRSLVDKRRHGL
jgi:hypothetical protein